jgi:3-dehydroquinate dehydratase-2
MRMKILIINGPNLNLLGSRAPQIYGTESFETFFEALKLTSTAELSYFQSNLEGDIINELQQANVDGIILNAGGYTHTSVAIRDSVEAIQTPVIEVHISNITAREEFRHTSLISPVAIGCVFGFGLESYRLALHHFESNKR